MGSDGISMRFRYADKTEWHEAARATRSPAIHTLPLREPGRPEVRYYSATYMRRDTAVGHYSNEVMIVCAPR